MKRLLIIAAILVIAATAMAAGPYIVADPQTDATKYRMRLSADGGVTWGTWTEGPPVSNAMRFDLEPVPKGTYKGEAQAGGDVTVTDTTTGAVSTVFQWSVSAPFGLKKTPGNSPIHIRGEE